MRAAVIESKQGWREEEEKQKNRELGHLSRREVKARKTRTVVKLSCAAQQLHSHLLPAATQNPLTETG